MRKMWYTVVTLIGLAGSFASIYALVPASPWRIPLLIVSSLGLTGAVIISGLAWFMQPVPWAVLPACKDLGIDRIHATGISGPKMSQNLSHACEIRIMAVSGLSLLQHQKPHIVSALRSGATLRILLAEKESQFVQDVEKAEASSRIGNISKELDVVQNLLQEFLEEAATSPKKATGKIFLGRYTTHLRSSLVLCDTAWGWLTLNLAPKRAMHSCSLELSHRTGGLLPDAIAHFEKVWSVAKSRNTIYKVGPSGLSVDKG